MKEKVLISIPYDSNPDYVRRFSSIVDQTSPRLTVAQLEELCSSKPVIGRVKPGLFGYKKTMQMGRFGGFDDENYSNKQWLWLRKENTNDNKSLGIGDDGSKLDIFQEENVGSQTQIALVPMQSRLVSSGKDKPMQKKIIYNNSLKTEWFPLGKDFLLQTKQFLNPQDQQRFSYLFNGQAE